ncbi:helix-turn-helix domain-containing protein [Micromonospora sp. CPCC 205371]|nr:helix-turn-helix domain-containing protein [Micromonospora sp. CPCC 205371]
MKLGKTVAMLRKVRGWTQEELAERCGLSVRTIRNVELGWVENPRQSSVNLLMRALDAEGVDGTALGPPVGTRWRGVPAPHQPIIGMRGELEELTRTVLTSRLTTLLGFGGVGKTRVALAAAATAAVTFRYGVALVELGDIPAEVQGSAPPTARVLERARLAPGERRPAPWGGPVPGRGPRRPAPRPRQRRAPAVRGDHRGPDTAARTPAGTHPDHHATAAHRAPGCQPRARAAGRRAGARWGGVAGARRRAGAAQVGRGGRPRPRPARRR